MATDYSKDRREIVRKWGAEVRSHGKYHSDRWDEAMIDYDNYETDDDSFYCLRQEYLKLAGHPEYHY